MTTSPYTGGCQCGAVRFRIDGPLANVSVCYCRMCQKSSGQLVGIYGATPLAAFTWTRGAPKVFRTSAAAERGFCGDCGTNLTFRYVDKPRISITIGSLDDPRRVEVSTQYGIEGKMPWFDHLLAMTGTKTEDEIPASDVPRYRSRQHPDHDTDVWPPNGDAS